jgi:hypothetical protein
MSEVWVFAADKALWMLIGYLVGAGTRLEVTRVSWWFMRHGIGVRRDREKGSAG